MTIDCEEKPVPKDYADDYEVKKNKPQPADIFNLKRINYS